MGAPRGRFLYLTDQQLTSEHALALGLVDKIGRGTETTKESAWQLARRFAINLQAEYTAIELRCPLDSQLLAVEAVSHMECQRTNVGMTVIRIARLPVTELKVVDVPWFTHAVPQASLTNCCFVANNGVKEETRANGMDVPITPDQLTMTLEFLKDYIFLIKN